MVEDGDVLVVSVLVAQMEEVKKTANENRWSTISDITGSLSLLYGTCQRMLLCTYYKSARCVCDLLADEQKQRRVPVCPKLLNEVKNDPYLLSRIITGDYCNDPEARRLSS